MISKIKSYLLRTLQSLELWTLLFLALASWQWSASIFKYVSEPDVWDEPAIYIRQGLHIAKNFGDLSGLFAVEGPLYSGWYALLSLFESDPFYLYYLNGRLLCFLLPLALFVVCRSMKMGALASALAAISFLLFPPLLTINRWNNHFLLLNLFIGFAMIVRIEDKFRFAAAFVALNIFAAFIRPEFQIGVLISLGYFGFVAAREFRWREKRSYFPVGVVSAALAFFAQTVWLRDLQSFDKGRYVFFDYTSRRYPDWKNLSWSEIVAKLYGPNINSPVDAFFANPVELLTHVSFYGQMGLSTLGSMIRSYSYLLETFFGLGLLLVVVGLGGLCFAFRETPLMTKLLGERTAPSKRVALLAAILMLSVIAVICLYGSVPRYLFTLFGLFSVLPYLFVRRAGKPIALAIAVATCLLCTFAPVDYGNNSYAREFYGADNGTNHGQHAMRATILAFRALRLRDEPHTLTMNFPGLVFVNEMAFAGKCWNHSDPCYGFDDANTSSLRELIEKLRFNKVYIDYEFRALLKGRLRNEKLRAELERLIESPSEYDFTRVRIPCSENQIFVRNASLHPDLPPDRVQKLIAEAVQKEVQCSNFQI